MSWGYPKHQIEPVRIIDTSKPLPEPTYIVLGAPTFSNHQINKSINSMPFPLTTTSVRSVIERTFNFHSIPTFVSLKDCGVDYSQLQILKRKIFGAFNLNIDIELSDTVDSIHTKLLAK